MKRFSVPFFLIFACFLPVRNHAQSDQQLLRTLDSLGEYYFTLGRLDSSRYYHKKALTLAGKSNGKVARLNAYNWLFVLHHYAEEADSMKLLITEMTPLAEQIEPETPNDFNVLSSFWGYKSFFHYSRGELAENVNSVRKSLLLYEKQPEYDTTELAILYQNVGIALEETGEYNQANTYSKKALELLRPSPLRSNIRLDSLRILNSIGVQLARLKKHKEAEVYFQKGNQLALNLGKSKEEEAMVTTALFYIQWGSNAYHQAKYAVADHIYGKARVLLERSSKITDIQLLLGRYLARNALAEDQLKQAEQLALNTLQLIQDDFPNRIDQKAATRELVGDIHLAQNQISEALSAYQEVLQLLCPDFESAKSSENPSLEVISYSKNDLLRVLRKKGYALRSNNQSEEAFNTYRLATDLFQNIREDFVTEEARLFLSEQTIPLFEQFIELAIAQGKHEIAFQLAEQSKALLLQEALKDEEAYKIAGIPPELMEQVQQLRVRHTYWEKALFDGKTQRKSNSVSSAQNKLFQIKREQELLRDNIRKEYPRFFDLKYQKKEVSLKDLRNELLSPGTALIEYFVSEEKIFLFGITQDEILVKQISKDQHFSTRATRFLNALHLESTSSPQEYASDAHWLFRRYLFPVLQGFQSEIKHLYLVPDGVFSYIPFEALLTESTVRQTYSTFPYLLKNYRCTYGYSSALLLKAASPAEHRGKAFVGFAPDFKPTSGLPAQQTDLGALKYNIEAVNTIRQLTKGISYTHQAANKDNLFAPSERPLVLHLSTHARMDDKNPIGSKIFLADGDISTKEIYNLPYSCRLVVLSACETGTGKYYKGEGMMSLARAFMQSGSPSVVTSLWKVDDQSTGELMLNFYEALIEGRTKDQALHQAKLEFLKSKESETLHHPYYWAAFIHIGDASAISFPRNWSYWLLSGLAIIGLISLIYFRGFSNYFLTIPSSSKR